MKNIMIITALAVTVACSGPVSESTEQGHHHESEPAVTESHDEHAHQNEEQTPLTISPDMQKEWGIQSQPAEKKLVSAKRDLPGIITLNENRTAQVTPYVQGQIVSLKADLGDNIRRGQPVLVIKSPEFAEVQAGFLRTRAKMELSRRESERAEILYREKAIEEREYLRRRAEYDNLITEYGALGSTLHSYGLTHKDINALIAKCQTVQDAEYKCELADPNLPILSPISGTVIERNGVIGEQVSPEKPVYSISDLRLLWAVLDAYEEDMPFLKKDSRVSIHSPVYPEISFEGRIIYIGDIVDQKLRTIKVRIEVKNPDGRLKPNMFIRGSIETPSDIPAIAIPDAAVQNIEGEKIIFIRENETTFSIRHIRIGERVGNMQIILSGLKEGEEVVTDGAFTLKTEMTKGTFGHAHVH